MLRASEGVTPQRCPPIKGLCCLLPLTTGMLLGVAATSVHPQSPPTGLAQNCPPSVLSRLTRRKVAVGETLASIANQYRLLPATLMGINPKLRQGRAPVGLDIIIPPFNGMFVALPPAKTLKDVAKAYRVRVDALYTQNGCTLTPKVVFVPGAIWSPLVHNQPTAIAPFQAGGVQQRPTVTADLKGDRYPLPTVASIIGTFGRRVNPDTGQVQFYSGVDLAAAPGTAVFAVANGTVAFAGNHLILGQQLVINHQGGRQTRYAQVDALRVKTGQRVQRGQQLATVGDPQIRTAYLRFELRYRSAAGWVAQDPQPYLAAISKP